MLFRERAVGQWLLVMRDVGIAEFVDIADALELASRIRKGECLPDGREDTAEGWLALEGMIETGTDKTDWRMN